MSVVIRFIQGFASVLSVVQEENNLGHPICGNLRDGNWMMEYIVNRLRQRPNLAGILFCY
jgi:glycogen debranching enzyme